MSLRTILKSIALFSLLLTIGANAETINGVGNETSGTFSSEITGIENEDLSIITRTRPLSDWVSAQGTSSTFFPPIGDYVGWTDGPFTIFALVDYAGVANRDLKLANPKFRRSLGTSVKGYVTEQEQADRTIAVTVRTWTTNALGFAQSIDDLEANDFNFAETSTIFGEKAVDVANGAKPALGHVSLTVSFSIPASGDRLPDLVNVVFNDICNFVPFSISLDSVILGTRPDGTKAIMRVEQEGALEKEKQDCDPDNDSVSYTKEIIEIKNIVE